MTLPVAEPEGTDPAGSVPALVDRHAELTPDRTALQWDGGRLSYGDLVIRANQLAHFLNDAGVKAEARVAVLLERGPDMVAALLAVLKAGGAYVPLDVNDTSNRVTDVVADAGCLVLLTQGGLADRARHLADLDVEIVDLDVIEPELARRPASPSLPPPRPESLAYVMYTSGSTGRPKGVAVQHGSIVNMVSGRYTRFGPGETFCGHSTLAFDASTFEIWGALTSGARLALPPPDLLEPDDIGQFVTRHEVTVLWLTKGLFDVCVEAAPAGFGRLRQLMTGGDALSPSHVLKAMAAWPHVTISNGYGPTETTTFATVLPAITMADIGTSVSIGPPIDGVTVYVLDEGLLPAETGELYVGGRGLARGYTSPALTAERFVPDPYAPGGRMYRTGDLVRRRPDGGLDFIGRTDDQVKIRGFRVEPGETELVLAGLPGVRQVCCVPRPDPRGVLQLGAYVVLDDGIPVARLRTYAQRYLPHYLCPAWYHRIDELPLTRNGKVDRRALPEPAEPEASMPAGHDGAQAYLAALWREELRASAPVGPDDDFISLGGDSLSAIRMSMRIRRETGKRLRVVDFLAGRGLAELADLLERTDPERAPDEAVPRPKRQPDSPLSPFQHGMWVLHQIYPECVAYNVPVAFAVDGPLDIDALTEALAVVVQRHEALRTSIGVRAGEPRQRVLPAGGMALPIVDLSAIPDGDRSAELWRRLTEEVRRPFDLGGPSLARAVGYRLDPGRHVLGHLADRLPPPMVPAAIHHVDRIPVPRRSPVP